MPCTRMGYLPSTSTADASSDRYMYMFAVMFFRFQSDNIRKPFVPHERVDTPPPPPSYHAQYGGGVRREAHVLGHIAIEWACPTTERVERAKQRTHVCRSKYVFASRHKPLHQLLHNFFPTTGRQSSRN